MKRIRIIKQQDCRCRTVCFFRGGGLFLDVYAHRVRFCLCVCVCVCEFLFLTRCIVVCMFVYVCVQVIYIALSSRKIKSPRTRNSSKPQHTHSNYLTYVVTTTAKHIRPSLDRVGVYYRISACVLVRVCMYHTYPEYYTTENALDLFG